MVKHIASNSTYAQLLAKYCISPRSNTLCHRGPYKTMPYPTNDSLKIDPIKLLV